jgi:hypothetical protein
MSQRARARSHSPPPLSLLQAAVCVLATDWSQPTHMHENYRVELKALFLQMLHDKTFPGTLPGKGTYSSIFPPVQQVEANYDQIIGAPLASSPARQLASRP